MLNKLLFYFKQTFALEFALMKFLSQKDQQLCVSVLISHNEGKGFANDHTTLSKHILTLSFRLCFISSTSSTTYYECIFQYLEFSSHCALTYCSNVMFPLLNSLNSPSYLMELPRNLHRNIDTFQLPWFNPHFPSSLGSWDCSRPNLRFHRWKAQYPSRISAYIWSKSILYEFGATSSCFFQT